MTPMFIPGPIPYGNPPVFLAAVGERMTEVAGEVADGLLAHAFTTERYLREVTEPALERGLALAGKVRADVEISFPGLVVTGSTMPNGSRPPRRSRPSSPSTGPPPPTDRSLICTVGAICNPSSTRCPSGERGRRWPS